MRLSASELVRRVLTASPNSRMCFVLTVIAVLAATALRLSLGKIGVTITYPTYYLAILIVAVVCGAGWGILAIALSMLAVDYVFVPPPFSFALPSKEATVKYGRFCTGVARDCCDSSRSEGIG